MARFAIDYTFWLNLVFAGVTGWLIWLHRRHQRERQQQARSDGGGMTFKRLVVWLFLLVLTGGLVALVATGGQSS